MARPKTHRFEEITLEQIKLLQAEFKKRRVLVSTRGNAIRVAPNVYNMPDDFDSLLDCFRAVWA